MSVFFCMAHKHKFTWCQPWALAGKFLLHITFQPSSSSVAKRWDLLLFSHQQMLAAVVEESTWKMTISHRFSRLQAMVVSHLDYCNDLLPGSSASVLLLCGQKQKEKQNAATVTPTACLP